MSKYSGHSFWNFCLIFLTIHWYPLLSLLLRWPVGFFFFKVTQTILIWCWNKIISLTSMTNPQTGMWHSGAKKNSGLQSSNFTSIPSSPASGLAEGLFPVPVPPWDLRGESGKVMYWLQMQDSEWPSWEVFGVVTAQPIGGITTAYNHQLSPQGCGQEREHFHSLRKTESHLGNRLFCVADPFEKNWALIKSTAAKHWF